MPVAASANRKNACSMREYQVAPSRGQANAAATEIAVRHPSIMSSEVSLCAAAVWSIWDQFYTAASDPDLSQ